jgi:tRNA1(Val) A37 N6-methylase TrmN6
MSIIAYFWCLWGLCLCAPMNLTSRFSLLVTNGEMCFILPVARCFAVLNMTKFGAKFQNLCHPGRNRALLNIIMGERNEKKEEIADQKPNSVIHLTNNHIKLFYVYFANY